jgi:hypothetical protein
MMEIVIGVVFLFGVIVWVIWSIYNKTRNENISKERKKDEPEYEPPKYEPKHETGDWQKEFSDLENGIKENRREGEEAGQIIISDINHTRNQFCPDIEKVLMAFAKSINGNYQEELWHGIPEHSIRKHVIATVLAQGIGSYYVKYYVSSSGTYEFKIFIRLYLGCIEISDRLPSIILPDTTRIRLDLKDYSNVKFANELKNYYLRKHGFTK